MKKMKKGYKTIEYCSMKTSDGREIRVLFDNETNRIEIITDHRLLRAAEQMKDCCTPYVSISGFVHD